MGATNSKFTREYDIILAGGGTTACVVAGRLAALDPSLRILLIEAGDTNTVDPNINVPALYPLNTAKGATSTKTYAAVPTKHVNSRECEIPQGSTLGGGSSINFMFYGRGAASDYDNWDAHGWSCAELLPLFKRLESYVPDDESGDPMLHGQDGPVQISHGTWRPRGPQDDLIAAGESLGIKEIPDLHDFQSSHGMTRPARYISLDGKRQDTAHCYIHPLIESGQYPNLHVLVNTDVDKVIVDNTGRARGVQCTTKDGKRTKTRNFRASKMVVVSAGAFGSPNVLERSGIGGRARLESMGIPMVSEVPGVGENYLDHQMMCYAYKTGLKERETLDVLYSGRLNIKDAVERKDPILGWNGIDITSKIRPTDDEIAKMSPDFQKLWKEEFADHPDRPLCAVSFVSNMYGPPPDKNTQYLTTGTFACYPFSSGSVHISSSKTESPVIFESGFLAHPQEMDVHVWAYKKQREIYRRTNAYRGEMPNVHPAFPTGSKAGLVDDFEHEFGSIEERSQLPEIKYTKEDDKAIEEFIRNNVTSMRHGMGTCKMGSVRKGGVVDSDLNVYGVRGLKVADMSIAPTAVSAPTYNTAILIGEKAADIISRDLNLLPGSAATSRSNSTVRSMSSV